MSDLLNNKLLADYPRVELEDRYIKRCEELDQKQKEYAQLLDEESFLKGKLSRLKEDGDIAPKQRVKYQGSEAPLAFRQSQYNVKQLQDQIAILELRLGEREMKRDKLSREVLYLQTLLNFPNKKHKNVKELQKELLLAELIRFLTILQGKNLPPPQCYRIDAALSLLKNDPSAAEESLRKLLESTGANHPLFESLDMHKMIEERDKKVEDLRNMLQALKERHEHMTQMHSDNILKYQQEAELNHQKYRELMELQAQKESKEAEAARTDELHIILEGLRNEVALLEKQKVKIQIDTKEKMEQIEIESKELLDDLKKRLKALEAHNEDLRHNNSINEKKLDAIVSQYEHLKSKNSELRDSLQKFQDEYNLAREQLATLMSGVEEDPFETEAFVIFLNQMAQRNWSFETVNKYLQDIDELSEKRQKVEDKIQKYKEFKEKAVHDLKHSD